MAVWNRTANVDRRTVTVRRGTTRPRRPSRDKLNATSRGGVIAEKKILVVDDDPHVVMPLTFVLKKQGYHVSTAANGEEALEAIRELHPALMFLDLYMPGKSGYDVLREMRRDPSLSDVHVIVLTAHGEEADRERSLALGANEFMTKPFSPTGIAEHVSQLMSQALESVDQVGSGVVEG